MIFPAGKDLSDSQPSLRLELTVLTMNPNMNAVKSVSKLAEHYASTRSKDEHVTIEWDNLEYSVLTKDSKNSTFMKGVMKNNRILKNVSGRAESGQLLAIMGPTGTYFSMRITQVDFTTTHIHDDVATPICQNSTLTLTRKLPSIILM